MEKRVLKIDNAIPTLKEYKKTRVAAYARVSTDKDEQHNSLQSQKDYFSMLIQSNITWEFVGIYYDDGISGLTHKNRDGFNNMVQDALDGKIDFIITKSISRFARNTLDSLEVLRKLKDSGIGVYFQKENINTLDGKGEFVLTLMASFAQEESRSISENIIWGKRKSFAKVKVSVPFTYFLGYKRGKNGELKVDKKEARIIEFIYYMTILDYSPAQIVSKLEEFNIPSPMGNDTWNNAQIRNILLNEKYKGDALLQKSFTINYLTKEKKANEGELPMYYVENSHEPIVSKDVANNARKFLDEKFKCTDRPWGLSEKIICKECGAYFGSFRMHPEWRGGQVAWRCNNKYSSKNKCKIRHIYHEEIYKTLKIEIAKLVDSRDDLKFDILEILDVDNTQSVKISSCSNDDIDSIIKSIRVDDNHDVDIEFIDGTKIESHIYGTAEKAGARVKTSISNEELLSDFYKWLDQNTKYKYGTKANIKSGIRLANSIRDLSSKGMCIDKLVGLKVFKNMAQWRQNLVKYSMGIYKRYLGSN